MGCTLPGLVLNFLAAFKYWEGRELSSDCVLGFSVVGTWSRTVKLPVKAQRGMYTYWGARRVSDTYRILLLAHCCFT